MKGFSTEYTGILALVITPIAGNYLSDACAGEVSGIVATGIVSLAVGGYLLVKRYTRGGVTPLGVRI